MIIEAGKVPNEVDNILDSLNGWSATQFDRLFGRSRLAIVTKEVLKGFTIQGAETTDEFRVLKERYAEEDLTTIGMVVHLRKSH
jgi:hypothetical protein